MSDEENEEALISNQDFKIDVDYGKNGFQPTIGTWQRQDNINIQYDLDTIYIVPPHVTIVEQAKQLFYQGLAFYKQHNFQAALETWQQATELGKQLPVDNPEYLNDLAITYYNYGVALINLRRYEEAISHFQQAIELRQQLPLDNPEYRNHLVRAYTNCGNALADLRRYEEEISHYQQAIELGKQLPVDNPEYRNGLARAYHNYGLALANLRRYEEAISHYQQAIALCQQLPVDNPEYRNVLASAYNNCGAVLCDHLIRYEEAISHFQQAIELRQQLPVDNPKDCNDLASAYKNCGVALAHLRRYEEAISHYQQAIALGKQLPLDNPEYRNDLASAYTNCGVALYQLGRFKEAEDAIDESLTIAQQLEQQKIYWFRDNREKFFESAIKTYLHGSFNFLPELILEHLDPENEGAAPQSERMHQAALRGLLELYRRVYHTHPDLLSETKQTIERLAEIRAKYFTGTASGARLTAQFYEENVGDLKKAEDILQRYTIEVKDDPEGYRQLADFYVRRRNIQLALSTYQIALQKILLQPFEQPQQQATVDILKLIYGLMAQPTEWHSDDDVDKSFRKINEWYNDWSYTLSEAVRAVVKSLHPMALQTIETERTQWRKARSNLQLIEYRREAQQRFEIQIHITLQATRVLPTSLQTVIDILLNAQRELWQDDAIVNEETQNERIEKLQNTLLLVLEKLPESELTEVEQLLQQQLYDLWEKLTHQEQQFLKLGMRLYQDQIYVFAGMSFGSAVENSLKNRLFEPIKRFLQHTQQTVNYLNDQDFIAGFFDKNPNAKLMLGNLIGGFNQAFHGGKQVTAEQNAALLRQCLPLYQPDTTMQQRRAQQLKRVPEIRNRVHNATEQTQENVEEMIDIIYENQQDGFYRYFLTALGN